MGAFLNFIFKRMTKLVLLIALSISCSLAAPDFRFSCEECVREMHHLGDIVKEGAGDITSYLQATYCPTLNDAPDCEEHLAQFYVKMLYAVVDHYFVERAIHVCQAMGICEARKFTCDECIQGLEFVEAYLEDPVMIAEMTLYLEQNFCLPDMPNCKPAIARHFPAMHTMAMEKFMIPAEICAQEPPCTGETHHPSHHPHPTHPYEE